MPLKGYKEAIEPHWQTIRPMMIDFCTQFKPQPPTVFSKDSTSEFYKLAYEVYKEGKGLVKRNGLLLLGQASFGTRKITPGGVENKLNSELCTVKF